MDDPEHNDWLQAIGAIAFLLASGAVVVAVKMLW